MTKRILFQMITLFITAGTALGAITPQVDLGSASAVNGSTVTIPITLTNVSETSISAIGMDIGYDESVLENPNAIIGPAGSEAGKNAVKSTPSSGLLRIGVIGLNNKAIGDGIAAYVTFTIKTTAAPGSTQLTNTPSASDLDGNPLIVSGLNGSVTVTESPSDQYTLAVNKSGPGDGTVTSSTKGISCGSDCSETFPITAKPKKVTLKLKPDAFSTFLGWGGDCEAYGTKKSCKLTMDSEKNVTANFGLPDIAVSPDSYDFGDVTVKQSSEPVTSTIQNNGTGDLKKIKMKVIGTDAKMFKIKGKCSKSIASGGSCQFAVTFKPKSAGSKSATLQISSNDPDAGTIEIPLSGMGI
jgi:hypothetical protein